MARRANSGKRQPSGFAVRQWLSAGAAGVGLGVAAWTGSGVAAADSGSGASNAGVDHSSSSVSAPKAAGTVRGHSPKVRASRGPIAAPRSAAAAVTAPRRAASSRSTSPAQAVSATSNSSVSSAQATPTPVDPPDGTPSNSGFVSVQTPSLKERIDTAIYGLLDAVSNGLSKFPSNPITDFLQGGWLTLRRVLVNQAPTLNPSQTTGQESGTITGTLGAVDPESDPMMFSVLQNPVQGTVNLNPDGTFTYTPGGDFDGRDVFIVAARNTNEPAINVLDLFGNGITEALVVVEQGNDPRVTYTFTYQQTRYGPVVQRWSDEAEIGLEWAAFNLADQVVPLQDVTLTIAATAQYIPTNLEEAYLAAASSPLTATTTGFFPTVVQSRIQTGSPSVTKDGQPVPDGNVFVNFAFNWGYDAVVGAKQFNFESTMMHELVHAYGWTALVREPGTNVRTNWSTYSEFITDNTGTAAIDPTTYTWDSTFNPNLTGGNGGLYFFGTNEALAFGGQPAPLYTPTKWERGSSVGHLDDEYFNSKDRNNPRYLQLMNAADDPGPGGPNYLSSLELGILKDLGYTMA